MRRLSRVLLLALCVCASTGRIDHHPETCENDAVGLIVVFAACVVFCQCVVIVTALTLLGTVDRSSFDWFSSPNPLQVANKRATELIGVLSINNASLAVFLDGYY